MNPDTGQSPADADLSRLSGLIADLLDSWYDENENRNLTGLIAQAWHATPEMLTARKPSASDESSGGYRKPGSRPPIRLDLMAHVETTLDEAREWAHDLGSFTNGAEGEKALRRLPALLEATLRDCDGCPKCQGREKAKPCECRHRWVTKWAARRHSELATALGHWEPRADLQMAACPRCGRTSSLSVRREAQRVWCRGSGCGWSAEGTMAILAAAS